MNQPTLTAAVDVDARPACADLGSLFQHPLLEDAPAGLPPAVRRHQLMLARRACAACAACPMLQGCLYDAVVRHNVAGIAAGTTPALREAMRRHLDWHPAPEDFDTLLGTLGGAHVEHAEIIRSRQANPADSLVQLAERLGCSLSTVKRHLRQERDATGPSLRVVPPSLEQVVQAYRDVVRAGRTTTRALAA